MQRIGIIGVGSIGAPMARCLLRAGFDLTVCDGRAEALEAFRAAGAQVTSNAAGCASCDFVIVMVANDTQVEQVILGAGGLLESVAPGHTLLIAVMSTVLPQTIQGLAVRCGEKNVRLIDAPVSGLPVLAEAGKLTIMAGGEAADLEEARPVLRAMGENIFHTGALGTGATLKLLNNMLALPTWFLTMEAMEIAIKLGINPRSVAPVIEASTGCNFLTRDWNRSRAVLSLFSQTEEVAQVAMSLTNKDLEHASELAASAGVNPQVLEAARSVIRQCSSQEFRQRLVALL